MIATVIRCNPMVRSGRMRSYTIKQTVNGVVSTYDVLAKNGIDALGMVPGIVAMRASRAKVYGNA